MALLPIQRVALVMCGSYNPVTNMHLRMFELARDALRNAGLDPVIGFISPVSDGYKKRDLVTVEHRCDMIRAALKPSGWIHLDTWECSQPNWTPTRDVLEHFQRKMDDWWEKFGKLEEGDGVDPAKKPRVDSADSSQHSNASVSPVEESSSNAQLRQQRGLAAMYEEDYRRRSPSPQPIRQNRRNPLPAAIHPAGHPGVRVMFLCGADLFESFAVPGLWADEDILKIAGNFGIVCINRYGSNADRFIYESDLLNINRHNIFIVTDWIVNEISSTKVRRALRRGESVRYLLQDGVADYIYKHNLYGATPPLGDRISPHSFSKYFPMLTTSSTTTNGTASPGKNEDKSSSP